MTRILRIASLVATAAGVALTATPASAQSSPATQATASASIKKPLIISRVADMNFGDILLSGSGTFSAEVVMASTGTVTCPATVTCSGTTAAAVYNVSGNKSQQVNILADPTVTLTGSNGGTLSMAVSAPSNVVLTNSGNPGTNFSIGGTLTVPSSAADGLYSGTLNVTANYN
jgi:hypothetical protein